MSELSQEAEDTLRGEYLRDMARREPWSFTSPLIIQVADGYSVAEVTDFISDEIHTHTQSRYEDVGFNIIAGPIVSGEDLSILAEDERIEAIEIEGYGKAGI